MSITMDQAAALLGLRKPVHHRQRVCAECEAEGDFMWMATGDGYDTLCCAKCGAPVPDDYTAETRRWVGW